MRLPGRVHRSVADKLQARGDSSLGDGEDLFRAHRRIRLALMGREAILRSWHSW